MWGGEQSSPPLLKGKIMKRNNNNLIHRIVALCISVCTLVISPSFGADAETAKTEIVKVYSVPKAMTIDRANGQNISSFPAKLTCKDAANNIYSIDVVWENDEYRSYKDGTFVFTAVPTDSQYSFASSCVPQVKVTNKINGDFDSNSSRKYYFDHENDLLDFTCYYTENTFSNTTGYYDIKLSEKPILDYWKLQSGKISANFERTTENVWNGLNRASCVSSVILNSLQLYNFKLEVDYKHASDNWWYPYVLFGVQDPTRFFGKLYVSPTADMTTGEGTDLAFDRKTLAGGVYAYSEIEGILNVYGAVKDDGYGRLYFDKDISDDKNVLATYNKNETHRMSITVIDGVFGIQIDDSDVFYGDVDDEALGGFLGFGACSKGISFDNFKVTALDENGNEMAISSASQGKAPTLKEDNYTGWDSSKCPLEFVWGDGFDQTKR